MPKTDVLFYADVDGSCPLLRWLDGQSEKVQLKCTVRIERLAELGHELRRPEADFLRDGIHELRARRSHVNYRMLYFFHDHRAVITHGLTKEGKVPEEEIDLAVERMKRFARDPARYTYKE